MKKSLSHLMPAAILFASVALAGGPALAQQTPTNEAPPTWKPSLESVIVSGKLPKNYRVILTNSRLGEAFIVTASMQVPYSDLNLVREADAAEFGRRIHVAAHLVCLELDRKYPPTLYPILDGEDGSDCERAAATDGMDHANQVIAAARG